MVKVALLLLLAVVSTFAQIPAIEEFYPAKLLKVSASPPYSYTFDIGGEGYIGTSQTRLHLTEGSPVKIKAKDKFIYVIDEDGKIQETTFSLQYLSPHLRAQRNNYTPFSDAACLRVHFL